MDVTSPALSLTGVSINFGGLQVLSNISLQVNPGERRAIVGPNGAGKTTLFNLISGELFPSKGQIRLFGTDMTRLPTFRRTGLGLARTFQRNNLFFGLSVLENTLIAVQVCRGLQGHIWAHSSALRALKVEADRILELVGLGDRGDMPVAHLSYGEQRQLEIGLALSGNPTVLLLDEPTAGMSAAETERAAAMIQGLPSDLTLVIIEHDMDVIGTLAQSMTVLNFGEILAEGTVKEVKQNPRVMQVYLGEEVEGEKPACSV